MSKPTVDELKKQLAARVLSESPDALTASVSVSLKGKTETFNLKNLNSALANINDAIAALEDGNVSSGLSNARAAKAAVKRAIDAYDNDYPPKRTSYRRVVVVPGPTPPPAPTP